MIKTDVRLNLPLSTQEAYDFWISMDLSAIYVRHIFVPGILGVHPKEGWNRPGRIRTVYFDNTTTAVERLIITMPGLLFRSSLNDFGSIFGLLIREVNYECAFSIDAEGGTDILAEFNFIPKNWICTLLFKLLLHRAVANYIRVAFIKTAERSDFNL